MEGKDAGELGDVLHEGLDGAGGEFGEGVVGGSEDGEGAGAFQGLDEVGGGDGGDEGFEGVVADGDVYDVWHGFVFLILIGWLCCLDALVEELGASPQTPIEGRLRPPNPLQTCAIG